MQSRFERSKGNSLCFPNKPTPPGADDVSEGKKKKKEPLVGRGLSEVNIAIRVCSAFGENWNVDPRT